MCLIISMLYCVNYSPSRTSWDIISDWFRSGLEWR